MIRCGQAVHAGFRLAGLPGRLLRLIELGIRRFHQALGGGCFRNICDICIRLRYGRELFALRPSRVPLADQIPTFRAPEIIEKARDRIRCSGLMVELGLGRVDVEFPILLLIFASDGLGGIAGIHGPGLGIEANPRLTEVVFRSGGVGHSVRFEDVLGTQFPIGAFHGLGRDGVHGLGVSRVGRSHAEGVFAFRATNLHPLLRDALVVQVEAGLALLALDNHDVPPKTFSEGVGRRLTSDSLPLGISDFRGIRCESTFVAAPWS